MSDTFRVALTVTPQGDSGLWMISGSVTAAGQRLTTTPLMLCDSSELRSDLCELVHELTGFITPGTDGAFG